MRVMVNSIVIRRDSMLRGRRHRKTQGYKENQAKERTETPQNPKYQYIESKRAEEPESIQ